MDKVKLDDIFFLVVKKGAIAPSENTFRQIVNRPLKKKLPQQHPCQSRRQ